MHFSWIIFCFQIVDLASSAAIANSGTPDETTRSKTVPIQQCGIDASQLLATLILNGNDAKPGTWPWMVAIYFKKDGKYLFVCGGAVIEPIHVLTAAHCFDHDLTAGNYKVRVGGHDLSIQTASQDQDSEEMSVNKILLHPSYVRNKYNHDIALLKIAREVRKPNRSICLPDKKVADGKIAFLTGWGISTFGGQRKCDKPMGFESGSLNSDRISASTNWNSGSGPDRARLNFNVGWGSWFPKENTKAEYIQIDFKSPRTLTAVVTQGCANYQGWVTEYTVQSSYEGLTWNSVSNTDNQLVFFGNSDKDTAVTQKFRNPIWVRFIRISPQAWKDWISLRLEILGCVNDDPSDIQKCDEPMGLESGFVGSDQITASTSWDSQSGPDRARLNFDVGWSGWFSKANTKEEYIQVDFESPQTLSALVTQGVANYKGWITEYTVQSSNDGLTWNPVSNGNKSLMFTGNSDSDAPVTQQFLNPISARFLRVSPQAWNNWVGLRIEILGCPPADKPTSVLQEAKLPIQSTEKCALRYRDLFKVTEDGLKGYFPEGIDSSNFICAGDTEKNIDACKGDSGGPLMINNNRVWSVVGIVSVGNRFCGGKEIPTLFTKVEAYESWIKTSIGIV